MIRVKTVLFRSTISLWRGEHTRVMVPTSSTPTALLAQGYWLQKLIRDTGLYSDAQNPGQQCSGPKDSMSICHLALSGWQKGTLRITRLGLFGLLQRLSSC
ncbi:uncharacterized protein BDZ99DRAFT_57632 [Mytilinidion resinicola]|uniref:Uncharacterized protein n=1 Tax=Mytilinidion resinicola TaxID=574789 RepID=A0A6A6YKN9_9PEZI|nr:uncharacterized protein BDZ99DRAFT_57632 [Mytilinidion resinicola]KAF2808535.1 hypothetical protein BDZ99DRAFT_57632 [Mytilinidion resinicola]